MFKWSIKKNKISYRQLENCYAMSTPRSDGVVDSKIKVVNSNVKVLVVTTHIILQYLQISKIISVHPLTVT